MARYSGKIGFSAPTLTAPGVWEEGPYTERTYKGDVLKNSRRWEGSGNVNDNLRISNTFSIVADSFAYANIGYMKYITYLGAKWKIESVDIDHPRITISVGGIYHE